ncbi:MAG: class I SAM-dependent methyltransferase [Methanobrevibacter sp.]|jgi:predicted O-methyltransferase YrrM|nr:class I SAM-dependent methyltransferase [Candidatus Methanoflexus mossambicus]
MLKKGYYESKGYEIFKQYESYRKRYTSLASDFQISFLLGLIKYFKFSNGKNISNVLEIGMDQGVTSLYMLLTGFNSSNFKLHTIEIMDSDYYGKALENANSHQKKALDMNKGCTIFDIENILDDDDLLDLVFIDGGHSHPSPLIDLLYLLPYLHSESIVCLHDVVDHMRPNAWGESFIFTSWSDDKYRAYDLDNDLKPLNQNTLGVIKLPSNNNIINKEQIFRDLIKIAKLPFKAPPWNSKMPDENTLKDIKFFMEKGKGKDFYDSSFSNEFYNIFLKQVELYEKDHILLQHETNFFNYLFNNVRYLLSENKQMKKNINDNQNLLSLNKQEFKKLKRESIKNKKELDVIKDSNSWKLTKPFRKLRTLFK